MAGGRLPPPSEPPQNYEYCEYYEYCIGGIFHHCMILAGCASQRHARGPGGGSMVMPGARGAFAALGAVLVCGPATTANEPGGCGKSYLTRLFPIFLRFRAG